jgi:hypothetical protein
LQTQRELHDTRRAARCEAAERAIHLLPIRGAAGVAVEARRGIEAAELCVVEGVVGFGSELQAGRFLDREML